jgi:hypothetical protein
MTVLDATMELFTFFQSNDCFEINKDFSAVVQITDNPEQDRAAVQCALEEMEEFGVLRHHESDSTTHYILKKSLDSNEQEVKIAPMTAVGVSKAINGFCHIIEDYKDECDPLAIEEKDIQNLVFIVGFLAHQGAQQEEEQKE